MKFYFDCVIKMGIYVKLCIQLEYDIVLRTIDNTVKNIYFYSEC